MKAWSKEEIEYLKENYGKMSLEDVTLNINRSRQSIYAKAFQLGLTNKNYFINFSKEEFLNAIRTSKSHREAQSKLGCSWGGNTGRYKNFLKTFKPSTEHFTLLSRSRQERGGQSLESLFNYFKRCAERRKLDFKLTFEEVLFLISKKCYYCNQQINSGVNNRRIGKILYYTGIDRKDNNIGYIKDNCVPCCKYCNFAKYTMTENEFLEHIKRIYEYQQQKDKS